MKQWLIGWCLFLSLTGFTQKQASFSSIDWKMQAVDAPTPDSLSRLITSFYTTDLEKVRAVYSWITSHIAYNTNIYKRWKIAYQYDPDPLDTAAVWPSGDEMAARKIMRRRVAVCDGYSRLFKVLCQYAGIAAEVVQGYGRANGIGEKKFGTNHTWNVVKIDSAWQLVDVTWASGSINGNDDYVARQNDFYFLTPPAQFIQDHYPEDLRWALLNDLPSLSEFKKAPFRSKNFYKYDVASYFPKSGTIEAFTGDTVLLSVELKDVERAKRTGSDPFIDTANFLFWNKNAFLKPALQNGSRLVYTYIVTAADEWLNLVFNDDVMLRYRLKIIEQPERKSIAMLCLLNKILIPHYFFSEPLFNRYAYFHHASLAGARPDLHIATIKCSAAFHIL